MFVAQNTTEQIAKPRLKEASKSDVGRYIWAHPLSPNIRQVNGGRTSCTPRPLLVCSSNPPNLKKVAHLPIHAAPPHRSTSATDHHVPTPLQSTPLNNGRLTNLGSFALPLASGPYPHPPQHLHDLVRRSLIVRHAEPFLCKMKQKGEQKHKKVTSLAPAVLFFFVTGETGSQTSESGRIWRLYVVCTFLTLDGCCKGVLSNVPIVSPGRSVEIATEHGVECAQFFFDHGLPWMFWNTVESQKCKGKQTNQPNSQTNNINEQRV